MIVPAVCAYTMVPAVVPSNVVVATLLTTLSDVNVVAEAFVDDRVGALNVVIVPPVAVSVVVPIVGIVASVAVMLSSVTDGELGKICVTAVMAVELVVTD